MDSILYPIIFIIVWLLIVGMAVKVLTRNRAKLQSKRYHTPQHKYVPGDFSAQMELDLRLPYRRFRQLYPNSGLSYENYKRLQMQRAFRRSMSSQDNKRMVR